MTPRPFHKWKTFWLGLLILAFLTWAWTKSLGYAHYASVRTGPLTWHGIGSQEGHIKYSTATYTSITTLPPSRTVIGSYAISSKSAAFPKAFTFFDGPKTGTRLASLSIAYWLIILIHLASWSALLLWRRQRIKRLLTDSQTFPQAEPDP